MSMQFSNFAAQNLADGLVAPEEIQVLRQLGWADGQIDPDQAETLFVTNDSLVSPDREWRDFFVAALSNFIVNTVQPHGQVDQEMADELIARIDRDGRVASLAELELLVRVLELASSAPDSLRNYTLQQIEAAVQQGDGPTRDGDLSGHGINAAEVQLLRRVVFAAGTETIRKTDAELLFRLKDAALYEPSAPEWQELFVQGVAEYLFGFAGSEQLSADRAAELEAFMQAEGAAIGAFLARMVTRDGADTFGSLLGEGEAEIGIELDQPDPIRLHDRLDADEELDDLEKALIALIDAQDAVHSRLRSANNEPSPAAAPACPQANITGGLGGGSQLALCHVRPWA